MAARRAEQHVLVVLQVDRIEVVVNAISQLHEARAVGPDLVQVERLLVVRLETAEDLPRVGRQVSIDGTSPTNGEFIAWHKRRKGPDTSTYPARVAIVDWVSFCLTVPADKRPLATVTDRPL